MCFFDSGMSASILQCAKKILGDLVGIACRKHQDDVSLANILEQELSGILDGWREARGRAMHGLDQCLCRIVLPGLAGGVDLGHEYLVGVVEGPDKAIEQG